jgi:class 3 adenylate cyclase
MRGQENVGQLLQEDHEMVWHDVMTKEPSWCDKPGEQSPGLRLSDDIQKGSATPARHRKPSATVGREALTILWLEWWKMTGDSHVNQGLPTALPWALAQPWLQHYAARYAVSKRQGQVILAAFDDVNAGLRSAWQIRQALHQANVQVRVGMHWGDTVVHLHPLTPCISIIGASVQGAVRLAHTARPYEVLLSADIYNHAQVQQERFEFLSQQRRLQPDSRAPAASQLVSCYVLTLVSRDT